MILFMFSGFRIVHLTCIFFGGADEGTTVRQHINTRIQRFALHYFGAVGNTAPR